MNSDSPGMTKSGGIRFITKVEAYEGRVAASRASDVLLLDCPSEDIRRCLLSWDDGFVELELPPVPAAGRVADQGGTPGS